jgi:DNA-binding transcriptional regulator WhiA
MVEAASRQTMAIRRLRAMGQLATLDETLQRVAAARLAAPEATLSELAAELGVHRSLVQRALRRLEELAREAEEGRDSPAAAPTPPAGRPSSLPPSHLA